MSFDRKRRGKGRDKWDNFGEDNFDDFGGPPPTQGDLHGGGGQPTSYNNDRGGFGGDNRGGGGGGMPAQVIGNGSGIVKFFNSQKGFGFIQCEDRPDDVFVHISAVEAAGLQGLAEGQPLEFSLVDRGGKVSASDLVIDGEPLPVQAPRPREDRGGGLERRPQRQPTGERTSGTVKFFNETKGFGFIERDSGGDDVFVHISALERAGMGPADQGDRLAFDIEVDQRGKFSANNVARAD